MLKVLNSKKVALVKTLLRKLTVTAHYAAAASTEHNISLKIFIKPKII